MTVTIANLTAQWSNANITYTGLGLNVNSSGFNSNSNVFSLKVNNSTIFVVDPLGNQYGNGNLVIKQTLTSNSILSNTINSSVITDTKGGIRDLPINNQIVGYALNLADTGKIISTNAALYVPNAVFYAGNAVSIFNNSSSSITITQNSSVTLYQSGTSSTGNRTLAQRGIATVLCVAANTFVISGAGIT